MGDRSDMSDKRIEVMQSGRGTRQDLADAEVLADAEAGRGDGGGSPAKVSRDERRKRRLAKKLRERTIKIIKRGARMLGFVVLTVAWIVVGGFMFRELESTNEIEACKSAQEDYDGNENATLTLIMDISSRLQGISTYTPDQLASLESAFGELLDQFGETVIGAGRDSNSSDCATLGSEDNPSKWNFMAAALFSMTIAATIGYGNIAPATMWGRIVCIAYALVGVPIFMFTAVFAGSILSDIVGAVYKTCCCLGCCRKRPTPTTKKEDENEVLIASENGGSTLDKGDGRAESPVGDGKQSPTRGGEKWSDDRAKETNEDDEEDDDEEEEEEEEEAPKLPITVSLGILVLLVFVGGLIFSNSEEDWTLETAAYFSFITISTIGFGDYVPGAIGSNMATQVLQSLYGIVYIIFGIAGFSMVISLIVDELSAKMDWFAIKFRKVQGRDEFDDKVEAEMERQLSADASAPALASAANVKRSS